MHHVARFSLACLALFIVVLVLVVFVVRPSGNAAGVAFVLADLLVALIYAPTAVHARHNRRSLSWFDWFMGPNVRLQRPLSFCLSGLIVSVAIPIEFTAGDIGQPLPLWFRTAAIIAVCLGGLALAANLGYELRHRNVPPVAHSGRS